MKYSHAGSGLVFGAPQGDEIGEAALEVIEEKFPANLPKVRFSLYEEYNNGILVAFFTPKKQRIKRCRLRCAAHEFFLKEDVTLVTPLVVGGHRQILTKGDRFKTAVSDIVIKYLSWYIRGLSLSDSSGKHILPWGPEPMIGGGRRKSFMEWKKEVENYLKERIGLFRPVKSVNQGLLIPDFYTGVRP